MSAAPGGRRLWIASDNAKKRAELERLLAPLGFELKTLSEAPAAVTIVENAPDFAGNAAKKAVALATVVGEPALGDDSGLCVDALGGRPGVHSARWAGPTDQDRIEALLAALRDVPPERRTGRFVCHLCLAGGDGRVLAGIEESCHGRLLSAPRGSGGFGYDPLFVADGSADGRTFAELSSAEKDAFSHRGKALRRLRVWLESHPPA